jgi:hypothetical protein
VGAEAADHLAADALDAHELVDGAKRVALPVGDDGFGLGRADAGEERQHLGRRRVQVHGAIDGLAACPRRGRERPPRQDDDDDGETAHEGFSDARARRCL